MVVLICFVVSTSENFFRDILRDRHGPNNLSTDGISSGGGVEHSSPLGNKQRQNKTIANISIVERSELLLLFLRVECHESLRCWSLLASSSCPKTSCGSVTPPNSNDDREEASMFDDDDVA